MNKTNKIIFSLLIIVGLIFVGFGVYKGFIEEKPKEEQPKQEEVIKKVYSGVYQNGDAIIKFYQKKDDSVLFNLDKAEYSVTFDGKITNNIVENSILENTYKVTFNDNTLTLETNDTNLTNATYNKISDYTINNYYSDNYGNESFLNSKYNGEFKQGDITAYLYQKDEKTVRVSISKGFNSQDLEYEIKDDNHLYTEMFEKKYEIEFKDNTFTFKETSTEKNKVFDGTYTKVKTLTMEEIIEKFI